jgi:tetratricopeptide (TPR) repeat protein
VPGAIASFRQATTQAPKAYAFAMNLARAHLANRDLDSALEVLNGVLKSEPKYGPALALAAAASLQAGAIEKAAGYVERLRQAAPDAPATLALDGDVAMAQKRYKDALASYRKASAQGSNTALVLSQYRAASLAGEPNAAKVLEDWVAKNPGDVGAVAAAAELRHAKGDKDGAIALYETALARTPNNVVLLNNLAMLYDADGNPKAVEYAERAYKSAPQAPAVADTYGWILFKQGKTDQAYDLIREAANKLPDNAEVQYHLAAVLAKMGDQEQAVKLLRKASGSLPANVKPEAQKLLEQLTK